MKDNLISQHSENSKSHCANMLSVLHYNQSCGPYTKGNWCHHKSSNTNFITKLKDIFAKNTCLKFKGDRMAGLFFTGKKKLLTDGKSELFLASIRITFCKKCRHVYSTSVKVLPL